MEAKKSLTTAEFIGKEQRWGARNYAPVPVVVDRAQDCLVWDVEGKEYIDMMSAYSAISHGHLHPRIVAAARRQLERVAVTSRAYHGTALGPFLEKLCAMTGFERALPMTTGAEGVETAIKCARRWGYQVKGVPAGQAQILVARGNFHGRTSTIVGFSTEEDYRDGFGPFAPGFAHFDFGDMESVRAAATANTCAVLVEPIQGEAGVVVPPAGFFQELREWCTRNNVLLILDEVQSGLGRTGRLFAFEHEGIRPDGLILGKALGGGVMPVSAFLADDRVMGVFSPGSHGSTFGGNALAAAVGLEALEVIEDENLVARSAALGAHLHERLQSVMRESGGLIRDVRGRGLWVGVDLDPAHVSGREIIDRLAARGVLSKDTHETVIRFAPPLTITQAMIDAAVDRFREVVIEKCEELQLITSGRAMLGAIDVWEPATAAGGDAPSFLMSPPDHYEVSYSINPWMDPQQWQLDAKRLARDAAQGWEFLRSTYEQLGAKVIVKPPVKGLPDLVFTANCAVVLDGKAILARYLRAERVGEEEHGERMFEQLKSRGAIDEIHRTPDGVYFEGAGDAIFDPDRRIMWMGYGQRSCRAARDTVESVFGIPTISLELVDPRYYHLDTALCLLSGGEAIYHPGAFTEEGRAQLKAVIGDKLIEAPAEDAGALAVNGVCIGHEVVMCHCSEALMRELTARGYRVHVVPLGSFNRSGGAAYCLTLELNNVYQGRARRGTAIAA
ncbi:MAG TPA: ornithine--oxo-acid transaminase [Ramlibacter sp.]|nr:ornithine--oxo-acid transaminase [Ramlibacter sp.]